MARKKQNRQASTAGPTKSGKKPAVPQVARGSSKEEHSPANFPVAGIGASAGGIEAIKEFFSAMKPDSGIAFVVVTHLDPQHKSAMPEILSKVTRMPVAEVKQGVHVEPDHVYILPPNTEMAIVHGVLRLAPRPSGALPNPIDTFLWSLAEDRNSQAVGIILSGSGSDGSRGLRAIKGAGGVTFAQDQSASYPSMPRSAVQAGCVDFVLSPAGMAAELVRLKVDGHLMHVPEDATASLPEGDEFPAILRLLSHATGVDFSHYKFSTLRRRVERRMMARKLANLADYLGCLRNDSHELQALYEESLIQVTSFFRDPQAFEVLKRSVFPELLERHAPHAPLRVWVPGCSSGEEVYSLAILMLECLEEKAQNIPIKLFGTDISEKALAIARDGVYFESIAADVSAQRLRRFFVKTDGTYQVNKKLRDLCVFARQDVARDPPFSHLDLVSCRNVLIYLDQLLQKRILPMFHYALKPSGFLLLGTSEGVGNFTDLFDIFDKKHKIFHRTAKSSRLDFTFAAGNQAGVATLQPAHDLEPQGGVLEVQREADRLVLGRYAPPGVVVDEQMQVVQFRGHTGGYLEPAPGTPTLDLLQMAREGLLADLRATFEKAKRQNLPARTEKVQVKTDQNLMLVNIVVLPLTLPGSGKRYFVILFDPREKTFARPAGPIQVQPDMPPTQEASESAQENERLKQELAATRAYLQSVIEEKEASNEELRAANEEIVSNNEELQSTNEELETAKEELQATNEELSTVNDELQNRIAVASQLRDDLTNLIDSANIPTVVVSHDLCLRRLTPSAQRLLSLVPADIGRPIGDFKLKVNVDNLEALLQEVLATFALKQLEVTDRNGLWYKMSIHPYKREGTRIDGAVITFVDIDALKRREKEIGEAQEYCANIIRTVREPLIILDARLRVLSANPAFYDLLRTTPDVAENQSIFALGAKQWDIPHLHTLLQEILVRDQEFTNFEISGTFPQLGQRIMLLNARRIVQRQENPDVRILLAIEDITERKRAEEAVRDGAATLRAIVATAADAILTVNAQGIIESFNTAAERMFGFSASEMIGQSFARLLSEPFHGEAEEFLRRYIITDPGDIGIAGRELKGKRKDNRVFPLELALNEIEHRHVFTCILRDISRRQQLEREVLEIASLEQRRIGQELHDDVGQELTGLGMMANALVQRLESVAVDTRRLASNISDGLERIHEQVRALSRGLIPVEVDGEGLRAAFEDLASRVREQGGIDCRFDCDPGITMTDPARATHLYRIAQEAVSNALRHGQAKNIHLALRQDPKTVTLTVQDDGKGIRMSDDDYDGMGIKIMRYRASLIGGSLKLTSSAKGGTLVTCTMARDL